MAVGSRIRRDLFSTRLLEVSQQCLDDLEALYTNNPSLQSALNAVDAELLQLEEEQCPYDFESSSCEITIDWSTLSSEGPFRNACEAAGGTYYTDTISINCSGELFFESITYSYVALNAFDCFPSTCDTSNVSEQLDEDLKDVFGLFEGFGLTCATGTEGSGGTGGSGGTVDTSTEGSGGSAACHAGLLGGSILGLSTLSLVLLVGI